MLLSAATALAFAIVLSSDRQGATCIAATDGAVAIGGHGGIDLYLPDRRVALGAKRNVFALVFSGDRLLEAGGKAGESGLVQCWSWKDEKLIWSKQEHDDVATSVAAAGGLVFSGSADKSIAVLDAATGQRRQYLTGHAGPVLTLAASSDGKILASAGADRSIRIWSVEKLEIVRSINNHSDSVNALAWSPDGKRLASASSDRTVRIWQPDIGRLVRIVRGHDAKVLSLAYGPEWIASGAADGKVRRIDVESDAILESLEGHKDWVVGVAIAQGKLFSADWSGRALLWRPGMPPQPLDP